jgi:carbamoyl-phosphate synthase large subunit
MKVPYYTTAAASAAAATAIVSVRADDLEVRSLQDYYSGK